MSDFGASEVATDISLAFSFDFKRVCAVSNAKFSVDYAKQFIEHWHNEAYSRVMKAAAPYALHLPELPAMAVVDTVFRACGQYSPSQHKCTYSLPYCMYEGTQYYSTIVHEMCHAFQYQINSAAASHGAEFKLLIGLAIPGCNPDNEIYHTNPIVEVIKIADELKAANGGVTDTMSFLTVRRSLSEMRRIQNQGKQNKR